MTAIATDAEWDRGMTECLKIEFGPKQKACADVVHEAFEQRVKEREAKEEAAREAQRKRDAQARKARTAEDAKTAPFREQLAGEYRVLLGQLYPNHNYIKVAIERSGKGFALYGHHPFFTKYEFNYGRQGPQVNAWVVRTQSDLIKARINKVGIKTDQGDTQYYEF